MTTADYFEFDYCRRSELRHLMESICINQYSDGGENEEEKPQFVTSLRATQERSNLSDDETIALSGRVYTNTERFFDQVLELAWNYYIGGYQPAQKWLKDRKGRVLEFEDILHYQKIIKAANKEVYFIEVKFRANGTFTGKDLPKNYPYTNAYIVLVSKKHIKCLTAQELLDGQEITPESRNYLGSRKEFDLDKEIIIEFCKFAIQFFEGV